MGVRQFSGKVVLDEHGVKAALRAEEARAAKTDFMQINCPNKKKTPPSSLCKEITPTITTSKEQGEEGGGSFSASLPLQLKSRRMGLHEDFKLFLQTN